MSKSEKCKYLKMQKNVPIPNVKKCSKNENSFILWMYYVGRADEMEMGEGAAIQLIKFFFDLWRLVN